MFSCYFFSIDSSFYCQHLLFNISILIIGEYFCIFLFPRPLMLCSLLGFFIIVLNLFRLIFFMRVSIPFLFSFLIKIGLILRYSSSWQCCLFACFFTRQKFLSHKWPTCDFFTLCFTYCTICYVISRDPSLFYKCGDSIINLSAGLNHKIWLRMPCYAFHSVFTVNWHFQYFLTKYFY